VKLCQNVFATDYPINKGFCMIKDKGHLAHTTSKELNANYANRIVV